MTGDLSGKRGEGLEEEERGCVPDRGTCLKTGEEGEKVQGTGRRSVVLTAASSETGGRGGARSPGLRSHGKSLGFILQGNLDSVKGFNIGDNTPAAQ